LAWSWSFCDLVPASWSWQFLTSIWSFWFSLVSADFFVLAQEERRAISATTNPVLIVFIVGVLFK
jgi:hypothetical protein